MAARCRAGIRSRSWCRSSWMLDLAYLRENIETARQRLAHRGFSLDVETFQRLDGERKTLILDLEKLQQFRNSASREKVDTDEKRNELKAVSQQVKEKT